MPARLGVGVPNANQLNPAQHAVLEAIENDEGWNAGIKTAYFEVLRRMRSAVAPTRRLVRDYLSKKVGWQVNQVPRAPLTVAPIIPDQTQQPDAQSRSLACVWTPSLHHRARIAANLGRQTHETPN